MQKLLHKHRIEKLIVTNSQKKCLGLITVKDIEKSEKFPFASKDRKQSLIVGAAVGVGADGLERARALIKAGCDFIVVDTAHGHSEAVIEVVKKIRKESTKITLIAGNIATEQAAIELAKLRVDAIKVGIGPGSNLYNQSCSRNRISQFSAILNEERFKKIQKYKNYCGWRNKIFLVI